VLEKATRFAFAGIRPFSQVNCVVGRHLLQHGCSNFAARHREMKGFVAAMLQQSSCISNTYAELAAFRGAPPCCALTAAKLAT
jgi:hypothetical protein